MTVMCCVCVCVYNGLPFLTLLVVYHAHCYLPLFTPSPCILLLDFRDSFMNSSCKSIVSLERLSA